MKPRTPTHKTVHCHHCAEAVAQTDFFSEKAHVPNYNMVAVDLKLVKQEWVGPVAVATQFFFIGKCSRCGKIHFSPGGVDAQWPVDDLTRLRRLVDDKWLEKLFQESQGV